MDIGKSRGAHITYAVIILGMGSVSERRCYNVTSSLIGWANIENDHCFVESAFLPHTNITHRTQWPFDVSESWIDRCRFALMILIIVVEKGLFHIFTLEIVNMFNTQYFKDK